MKLPITKEWYEKRAVAEGDADPTTGRRITTMTINLTDDEIAELERLITPGNLQASRSAHRETLDLLAIRNDQLNAANNELLRLRNECADGLDALSDIDDFWEACPYRDNRKHLSPAEQLSSIVCELNAAHDALSAQPAPPDLEREIASVVQSVNEWDDRTSPDEYPDHLLITSEELADLLRNFAETMAVKR